VCRIDKKPTQLDNPSMMIAGKKTLYFSGCIQVRIDPDLRQ